MSLTETTHLQMAIKLNKYAPLCLELAVAEGRVTPESSPTPLMYDISRHWRTLLDATSYLSECGIGWSEKEKSAGDIILATVTYLQRIGCEDIEGLLKDILRQRAGRDV